MRAHVLELPKARCGRTFRVLEACNFELRKAGGGGAGGLEDDFVGGACGGGYTGEKGQWVETNPLSRSSRSSRRSSRTPGTRLESCPKARSFGSEGGEGANA